jgi:hypothetical protein
VEPGHLTTQHLNGKRTTRLWRRCPPSRWPPSLHSPLEHAAPASTILATGQTGVGPVTDEIRRVSETRRAISEIRLATLGTGPGAAAIRRATDETMPAICGTGPVTVEIRRATDETTRVTCELRPVGNGIRAPTSVTRPLNTATRPRTNATRPLTTLERGRVQAACQTLATA